MAIPVLTTLHRLSPQLGLGDAPELPAGPAGVHRKKEVPPWSLLRMSQLLDWQVGFS